ncbi:MAG: dephospho-CoA kinase [Myxococcales bacterium]|nr:dephospho-CoA kinase [Myxococcales bacterium]
MGRRIRVVGLTGNIACGKSTVARELERRGLAVIDADQLAREVVRPGSPALAEIARALGRDALTPSGELDRQRVAQIVFHDTDARRRLEAITHPRIAALGAARIDELDRAGVSIAFYEAALIVENNLHRALDALVVVAADERLQLERLLARNALTEDEARARISSQMPQARKREVADVVIENNGTLDDLRTHVDGMLAALEQRFASDRSQ